MNKGSVVLITNPADYLSHEKRAKEVGTLFAVIYGSRWSKPARDALQGFRQIARKFPDVLCVAVNVDACRNLALEHNIKSIPSFRVIKDDKVVGFVQGANLSVVKMYIKSYRTVTSLFSQDKQQAKKSSFSSSSSVSHVDGALDAHCVVDDDSDEEDGPVYESDGSVLSWDGYIKTDMTGVAYKRSSTERHDGTRKFSRTTNNSEGKIITIDDDDDDRQNHEEMIKQLVEMGFEVNQADEALKRLSKNGSRINLNDVIEWIVSHPTIGIASPVKKKRITSEDSDLQQSPFLRDDFVVNKPSIDPPKLQPIVVPKQSSIEPPKEVPKQSSAEPKNEVRSYPPIKNGITIRVRQTNGKFIMRQFEPSSVLQDVFNWVASDRTDGEKSDFNLVLSCPHKVFSNDPEYSSRTLIDCGLAPAASLMLSTK